MDARTPAVARTRTNDRTRSRKSSDPLRRYARNRMTNVEANHVSYQRAATGFPPRRSATGPVEYSGATPATIASVPRTRAETTPETAYTRGTRHTRSRSGRPETRLRAKWRNEPEVRLIPTHSTRIHGRSAAPAVPAGASRTTASPRAQIPNAALRRKNGRRGRARGTGGAEDPGGAGGPARPPR